MDSLMFPALQKFYNSLKQLRRFSLENSFFDNIGCIDTFLSEYRSSTLALQTSLGGSNNPIYLKNLDEYLIKDERIARWLNEQRVTVTHKHPFFLKKVLRIIIYDSGNAVEFKKYEQTIENQTPVGNYLQDIRNTFLSIATPEVCFSVQYVFVDEDRNEESNIFDYIETGVVAMWSFLHAMKADLHDDSEVAVKLMSDIDEMIQSMPHRWTIDVIDYCYYKKDDSFEKGESLNLMMPDFRIPVEMFVHQIQQLSTTVSSFFEAFIYFHAYAYIEQKHHILNTFFIEYGDGKYQTIAFLATTRTTMYRYINRVSNLIKTNNITNVYLVTEFVGYGGFDMKSMLKFIQLNYKEKMVYRTKTFLSFYKITSHGKIESIFIDADTLVDRLSVSVAMSNIKSSQGYEMYNVMLTPIVKTFKAKMVANRGTGSCPASFKSLASAACQFCTYLFCPQKGSSRSVH